MSGRHVAIRYAEALYEVAIEKNAMESVAEDMRFLDELINKTPEIRAYCLELHKSNSNELAFVEIAFQPYVSEITWNMLEIAVDNGRLAALPFLPAAFENIEEKKSGVIRILLETAHEPLDGLVKLVKEKMSNKTGKDIKIEHKINPDLMGGFKVWYEGRLIDNSAVGRLMRMKRLLKVI